MKRTNLIRLGGLAAMVGGVAWVVGAVWQWLDIVLVVLLALGAMVAVAALHLLQRERYGRQGALFALLAFVGLAMEFLGQVGNFIETVLEMSLPPPLAFFVPMGLGLLVASIGTIGLGVVTIAARVLPWWCGVALIAGSPLALVVEFMLLEPLLWALWPWTPIVPNTIPWAVLGAPWILVGYAIFRAGSRLPERPPRVRY